MTQTEIWQYMNVEAPTVTRTLTKLEQSGWIVRLQGKDKRERIVQLSEEAERIVPEIEKRILEVESELVSSLSEEEQEELIRLLKKIGEKQSGKGEHLGWEKSDLDKKFY